MRLKLYKIIVKNTEKVLKKSFENSYFKTNNGPYNDPETKVRAYSHWAITLLKAYEITKENKYKNAAKTFLDYLCSKEARPFGFTFYCRKNPKKDKCNGLIGQAWTIEALMQGYKVLKEEKYKKLARKVFLMHNFKKSCGYWKRREITGKKLFYDMTFNHQLWFAAIGSMISNDKNDRVGKQVNIFMDKLEKNISIHKNGLIRHLIFAKLISPLYLLKNKLVKSKIDKLYLYNKEAGYHAFNLYALALLKERFPNHKLWQSKKFKKILEYAISKEHFVVSEKDKYGFPFNPSGIETAFFVYVFKEYFKGYKKIMKERLEKQFKNHLDKETFLMDKNTSDPNTLSARIYEAVHLPNLKLEF